MVILLSHIALRLDNPVNASTIQFPLPTSFSPNSSAVRVNIFWFLSLILSLTTVLVGIISLQWLREHQSYPGRSARDTLAIHRMRAEGLDKWHVWKIFTTLPLLLQTALVLFLAGVMDFLHALGNKTIVVTIGITIGIVLLFLLATTFLPAFQDFVLYIRFLLFRPPQTPPSQCPYKSPQSGAFHAAFFSALRIAGSVALFFISPLHDMGGGAIATFSRSKNIDTHILHHLSGIWSQETWIDYDSVWLAVRDACQNYYFRSLNAQSLYSDSRYSPHRTKVLPPFPLFDITQILRKVIGNRNDSCNDDLLSAAYHCFCDLSRSFVRRDWSIQGTSEDDLGQGFHEVLQHNHYFHFLLSDYNRTNPKLFCPPRPMSFIDYGSVQVPAILESNLDILHHQNLFVFLDHITLGGYSKSMMNHRAEVMIRLGKALYQRHTTIRPGIGPVPEPTSELPTYLKGETGFFDYLGYAQEGHKHANFKSEYRRYIHFGGNNMLNLSFKCFSNSIAIC